MKLKTVYLMCALAGAIVPMIFFINFGLTEGVNPTTFVQALFVNGTAGGFTADVLISSFVFWIYLFSQQGEGPNQERVPRPWLFIALNLGIGLSCALPAYLYARAARSN